MSDSETDLTSFTRAEGVGCGAQVTTGARSDLQRATRWARHMVAECGMSDAIGPLFADQHVRFSNDAKPFSMH